MIHRKIANEVVYPGENRGIRVRFLSEAQSSQSSPVPINFTVLERNKNEAISTQIRAGITINVRVIKDKRKYVRMHR